MQALNERFKKLDILVGNAGQLGVLSPIAHIDQKAWDEVIAVNVTANFRLIRSLDPLLRAADAARAVFITSGAANKATAYWGPYAVSKTAMDMLVRTYAAEVSTTKIRVNLFNPGPIRTRMRAKAMPGEDPMTLEAAGGGCRSDCRRCACPSVTENGKLYNYPSKKWHELQRAGLARRLPVTFFRLPRSSRFGFFRMNGFSGSRNMKRIGTPGISNASRTLWIR